MTPRTRYVCLRALLTLTACSFTSCARKGDERDRSTGKRPSGEDQSGVHVQAPCALALAPLEGGHLGALTAGMPAESLQVACPSAARLVSTDEEGGSQVLYALPVNAQDTVFATIDTVRGHSVVRSFSVAFKGPHTADGIGVGSTFGEIKAKHPHLSADDNEGAIYVWPEPDNGVSFGLNVEANGLDGHWRQNPLVIPDTAHVTELLIRPLTRKG